MVSYKAGWPQVILWRGMKIHLKKTAKDHLALCGKWPEKNWVLASAAAQQGSKPICKICAEVARVPSAPRDSQAKTKGAGQHP